MTWKDIQGWFDFQSIYDQAANNIPENGIAVEIGTWKGRSAIYLADRIKQANKNATLFCIDSWSGIVDHPFPMPLSLGAFREFQENVLACGHAEMIIPVISNSINATTIFPDRSIDFVFLDASHDYASVKRDIIAWLPKVRLGGTMAGHDYYHDTVRKALEETIRDVSIGGACWIKTVV